jgi:uncharacterized protein (DUF1015 family)
MIRRPMEIKPFKAIRFDAMVVGDVGDCIAPPYDVIDATRQDGLYRQSSYNIVRITLGKKTTWDDESHNQYTRANEFLTDWIARGALKRDENDAIYGYVQDFELGGVAYQRLTFIALGKLEEFGKVVRPHEQVFPKPMQDRLMLTRATQAHFGLIFMLYDDPQGVADGVIERAAAQEPLIDFLDESGVRHRLLLVGNDADVKAISGMMSDKSCIIADGHHRYTMGLTYSKESNNPQAAYQMMAFTNMRQKGLVVMATHRVVGGIGGFQRMPFVEELKRDFDIVEIPFEASEAGKQEGKTRMLAEMKKLYDQNRCHLGLYVGGDAFHVAILKDGAQMASVAGQMSEAWRSLDVAVLQKLVLERLLGLTEEEMGNPDCVDYVKDVPNAIDEIIRRVDSGKRQIAFFTSPVKMDQLLGVADAGERMPHKSTYFYPKMYTGLTIQKLES